VRPGLATAVASAAACVLVVAERPAHAEPASGAADAERAPSDAFPRVVVGARAGVQSIYLEGDGAPSDLRGVVAGVDAALRLGEHVGVGGALEASLYDRRSDRLEPGPAATSYAAFAELRLDTHPAGPWSARIDLGTGYRWLFLPLGSGTTDGYGGFEPLRLHLGPSYRVGAVDVAVLGGVGFGWFTARPGARSCAVTAVCQDSLLDSDTSSSVHFMADLALAVRGWP